MGGLGPEALWTLSAVGLVVPVLAVAATSFARVLVVLGLLRGGLGLPDALPGPVLGALASVLTAVLMWPTALRVVEAVGDAPLTVIEAPAAMSAMPKMSARPVPSKALLLLLVPRPV
jgi:flagellar biosynthesis protein FliP